MNVNNFLYEKYGTFAYRHYSTILIEQILKIETHAQDQKMYVHVNNNHFEVIVTNKGNLTIYFTFDYKTKEDFIYYILFTIAQLSLNPETIIFEFIGHIDEDNDLYKIAYKYIRHIQIEKIKSKYTFSLNEESNHSNFILLNSF